MTSMTQATAKDKFYGPLKKVAREYIPLLMARMRVLERRASNAIEFFEDEADEEHELVWELDHQGFRIFNYETTVGKVIKHADINKDKLAS